LNRITTSGIFLLLNFARFPEYTYIVVLHTMPKLQKIHWSRNLPVLRSSKCSSLTKQSANLNLWQTPFQCLPTLRIKPNANSVKGIKCSKSCPNLQRSVFLHFLKFISNFTPNSFHMNFKVLQYFCIDSAAVQGFELKK